MAMLELKKFNEQLPPNSYLSCFHEAMKELFNYPNWICIPQEDMDDEDIQVYERNYIISLVNTLSKVGLKLPGIINGEVIKSLDAASDEVRNEYKRIKKDHDNKYSSNSCYVFPDLLIHEDHSLKKETWTTDNQHIIIEAKTSEIKDSYRFFLDFFKLNFYLHELHYENAVYLLLKTSVEKINRMLEQYMNKKYYQCDECFERLYFFVQEQIDKEPEIYKITNK